MVQTSKQPEGDKEGDSPQAAPPRKWIRWCVCVVSLFLTLGTAEGLVRIFGLGPPTYAKHRIEPEGGIPFTQIPNGPIVYQPNATFSSVYDPAGDYRDYFGPEGRVDYRINRFGMRGAAVPIERTPDTFRAVCLGDSFTFGEGVRYPDTYPAKLALLLSSAMPDRNVEVLNAGVQAYGTNDAIAFYLMRCRQFRPDAVTLGFFLNDVTEFSDTIRQNEAMTHELALSPLAQVSRLWEIFERGRHSRRLQRDYFASIRSSFESPQWDRCKEILSGMQQEVAQRDGFRFVVVLFPVLWALDGEYPFQDIHNKIEEAAHSAGCEFIDLLDVYRGRPAESLWVHPTDQHPNEIAHKLAAERIAEQLLALPPQAAPPKAD